LGGCLTRVEPFKRGPTCVFDAAQLTVKHESGNVVCMGELARIERHIDPEVQDKLVSAGFQFRDLSDEVRTNITRFIAAIGSGQKVETAPASAAAVAQQPKGAA